MTKLDEVLVMRFPAGTNERANQLTMIMGDDPQFTATGKVSKSLVLRIATLRGLEILEKEYKMKKAK
jgi:hypothetical protein